MLTVKGGDESGKQLAQVDKGMSQVRHTSLATKAAIVGVIYGLQRLMSGSSKLGTSLQNFSSATGLSAEMLQRWQYAGVQAGTTAEDIQSSIMGIQETMAALARGEGQPKGLSEFLRITGADMSRMEDTFYMAEKLVEFSKQIKPGQRDLVKSFGVSDGFFQAARDDVFNKATMDRAPVWSQGQLNALQKVNAGWTNFFDMFTRRMGAMNAQYGPQLIQDLTKVADKFLKLAKAMTEAANEFKVFEKVSTILNNIANALDLITGLSRDKGVVQGSFDMLNAATGKGSGSVWWLPESWNTWMGYGPGAKFKNNRSDVNSIDWNKALRPRGSGGPATQNNATINQTMNFNGNDGSNAQDVGAEVRKQTERAIYQMPAIKENN
jgi:hypothetical protein